MTILPWSRILVNELNITITKLTHTYVHTCTHKDANVYKYVQVTYHTLVPWRSTKTLYHLVPTITAPSYRTNVVHRTGKWHALAKSFPTFLLADSFRFQKITSNPHILARVKTECPMGRTRRKHYRLSLTHPSWTSRTELSSDVDTGLLHLIISEERQPSKPRQLHSDWIF